LSRGYLLYAKIVQQCRGCGSDSKNNKNKSHQRETLLLVDSVIGTTPVLDTLEIMSMNMHINMGENGNGPPPPTTMMLNINVDELIKLAGPGPGLVQRDSSSGAVSPPHTDEVKNALQALFLKHTFTVTANAAAASVRYYLALTDGKDAAYLADIHINMCQHHDSNSDKVDVDVYMLHPPDLSCLSSGPPPHTLLYPIDTGDAASAGTIAAWMFLTEQQQTDTTDRHGGDIKQYLNTKVQAMLLLRL
jgi:hypothetical protein